MYEVQLYTGTEWVTTLRTMDWGHAQAQKWALVENHGSDYVQIVYCPIL